MRDKVCGMVKRARWAGLVLAAGLAGSWSSGALAQEIDSEHFEAHALRYAGMVERAYGRLYGHIRNRSTSATSWSGAAVPPGATGWENIWTQAGIRARYCDDFLVVYVGAQNLKGVGDDHRAIQQARRSFLPERETGVKAPLLGWLDASTVEDSLGNAWILPPCASSLYTDPLPSGRAAMAGEVIDPWTDLRVRVSYETRESPCPAGQHGALRERREVSQEFNAQGVAAGPQTFGAWQAAPGSWCRNDYVAYDVFSRPCSWYQGEPFFTTLAGTETWRVPIQVSALGRIFGSAEFVSTTCWGTIPGPVPVPNSSVSRVQESRTDSCPPNHNGQIDLTRTRTTAKTTYPWGQSPLRSVEYTNWGVVSNTCTLIVAQNDQGGPGDNEMADGIATDGDGLPGDANGGNSGTGGNFGGGGGDFGGPGDK